MTSSFLRVTPLANAQLEKDELLGVEHALWLDGAGPTAARSQW